MAKLNMIYAGVISSLLTISAMNTITYLSQTSTSSTIAGEEGMRNADDNGGGSRSSSGLTWFVPDDLEKTRNIECERQQQQKQKQPGQKSSLALPNGAFCLGIAKYAGADLGLVEGLVDIFDGGSIVDLGAGLGWYRDPLLNHITNPIKSYEGFDGAMNAEEKSKGIVKHMDLTQPSALDARSCNHVADWVMSLEVGEHIPKQYEDAFLRNIRCRAKKGAIISWANVGQKGVNHINCKTREDAIKTVERWGFHADLETSKKLMKAATFGWFKTGNIVVYRL